MRDSAIRTMIDESACVLGLILTIIFLKAIDGIHQVGVYCLALVPANTLPKTPLGGIHLSETKQCFLEGSLHPCNVLMCPHTCVINLPKPRQKQPGNVLCFHKLSVKLYAMTNI